MADYGTVTVVGTTAPNTLVDIIVQTGAPASQQNNSEFIQVTSDPLGNFGTTISLPDGGHSIVVGTNVAPFGTTYSYTPINGATLVTQDGTSYTTSVDGGAFVNVVSNAVCFVTGTRILTLRGEVPVEDLVAGDIAVTATGEKRPIVWIGHRDLDGAGEVLPHNQQPVRIRAGAFGPGLPARDLRLSPGHPVLVGADADNEGGHLVPIMCLINGTTIDRVPVDSITYWHVEVDEHDIILAEGLPAESYFDLGSRPWFSGADGALHDPDMALPGMPGRCRPVAIDGSVVEAERRRLDQVFATRLAGACAWPIAEDALAL